MDEHLIYLARGRIRVRQDPDDAAVRCEFTRTFDEFGVFLPAAVRAGLEYATAHGLTNWVVDVADESDSMSDRDSEWEGSEEFRQLFRDSSIRNILLVMASSADNDELAGGAAWASGFAAELGDDFTGGAVAGRDDISPYLETLATR